ncbi:MAG: hypothetical protein M3N30_03790, partial [Bacteroidota bacterium]|nr:hypothetical protein [Bacteroidota bacterium]
MAARLHFKWLPDYARFLCENRISELSAEQLRLSAELQIPLLSYFAHLSPDQLVEFGKQGIGRLLDALSSNTAIE